MEDPGPHPNPQPPLHHRKIELQSPLDLIYLQDNLATSARALLDLHFPLSAHAQPATHISLDGAAQSEAAGGQDGATTQRQEKKAEGEEEDPLRRRVRELVDAFMARTWAGAMHNVSVNGLDATSLPAFQGETTAVKTSGEREEREGVDFEYASYDSRLQERVTGLYGELELLTSQVAKLRREAPTAGAQKWVERCTDVLEEENSAFDKAQSETRDAAVEENILKLRPQRDGFQEDVQAMYERGTGLLASLVGAGVKEGNVDGKSPSLMETMGKAQRARTVAMEFE